MTNNKYVLNWIDEMAAMTKPDKIVWIDGTEEQAEALRAEACSTGEMIKLNQELLPNCYLHRTAINDVARVEGRTYICTEKKEDAGNINNWMAPAEMKEKLFKLYTGSMKGRTMYVIPYSMGVVGSDFAKYGIELTDSIYVVLNMLIMTRVGTNVLEALGDSPDYIKGLWGSSDGFCTCEEPSSSSRSKPAHADREMESDKITKNNNKNFFIKFYLFKIKNSKCKFQIYEREVGFVSNSEHLISAGPVNFDFV